MSIDQLLANIAAREIELEREGAIVVPDWVTDPIDREMVRLGYAQAKTVESAWVGGKPERRVVDNATTAEERQHLNYKREMLGAVLRERKKRGGTRSAVMAEAVAYAVELKNTGAAKLWKDAYSAAGAKYRRSANGIRNAHADQKKKTNT